MLTSSELINIVKEYNPKADAGLLEKAYLFAMEAHGVQKRDSGAPYFYHPVDVARFLAELKFDAQVVVVGLLHDVLEDADVTFEELESIFGAEIAFLADSVTKLSAVNYSSSGKRRTENFRKFILATSRDVRALAVKLADRLSNMRTLNYVASVEKRKRIALETLEIYAPIAERIGMNLIKDEIEDVAFYNLHQQEYDEISRRLNQIRRKEPNFVEKTALELKRILTQAGIDANVRGREKRIFSIWKKMQKRGVSMEQINDVVGFRVIVDTVTQCYLVLGTIHVSFQIVPGRFKDYISVPKLNNYRSLHTVVIGPFKQAIEIQIRTREMDDVANEGAAIHWAYKSDKAVAPREDSKKYGWIKNLLDIFRNSENSLEIMSYSKLELFDSEIFCYSPKGDLISLPRGATVVDFAYEIHSDLGNACIGAKINGQTSPLRTVLKNGDQVNIITSPYGRPDANWIEFVVAGKAKSCVRKFMEKQEKAQFGALGLQLMKYVFSSSETEFDEEEIDWKRFSCDSIDKFYYNVGKGIIPFSAIWRIVPDSKKNAVTFENYVCLEGFISGIATHFAECCHPVSGDEVFGIPVPLKGLAIHAANCDCVKKSARGLVKVKWSQIDRANASFVAKLRIAVANKNESFSLVSNVINANEAVIINLKTERRSADSFNLVVNLRMKSASAFGEVQAALRLCSNVKSVEEIN